MNNYIGYHGTSNENFEKIDKEGFTYKLRENHWLSPGIYFYLDDLEQAKVFVKSNPNYSNKSICVIEAEIECDEKYVLDFRRRENTNDFLKFYKEIIDKKIEFNYILDEKDKNINRSFLISKFCIEQNKKIVIKTFLHKNKGIRELESEIGYDLGIEYEEIQLCVRDENCIKSIKKIYGEKEKILVFKTRKKWGK